MTFFHRLNQMAANEGLSLSKFVEGADISSTTVSQAKARKKVLSEESIHKIVTRYPKYSKVWLETGEGNMTLTDMNAPLFQVARENGQNKYVSPPMAEFEALRRENELLRAQVASLTQERDDYRTKFFEAQRELIDVLKQGRQN